MTTASISYAPGDVIIQEEPQVHVVVQRLRHKICDCCLKRQEQYKKCSGCDNMSYCDADCQDKDWAFHQNECPIYRRYPLTTDLVRLTIRFFFWLREHPESVTRPFPMLNGAEVCLKELDCDFSDNDNERLFESICSILKMMAIDFRRSKLTRVFGVLKLSHPIRIRDVSGVPLDLALAFTIPLAALKHSCAPNAVLTCHDLVKTSVVAMKEIGDGEEITINRIRIECDKDERLNMLRSFSLEQCGCVRCESITDQHIDYDKLKSLNCQLNQLRTAAGGSRKMDWQASHSVYAEKVQLIHRIYWFYHPEKSEVLFSYFCNKIMANRDIDEIEELAKTVADNLKVTHGHGHPLLRKLTEQMQLMKNKMTTISTL